MRLPVYTEILRLRISEEQLQLIREVAEEDERNFSDMCRLLMNEALRARGWEV